MSWVRVLAIICPNCGEADGVDLILNASSLRKPWYCAECLTPQLAAFLKGQDDPLFKEYRLLFTSEPVEYAS